ncbi:MAG: hypothetical protein IKI29_05120 [Clostridia bacterium]|nr:hypothetical protein [Clostridia bacterium]
MTKITLFGGDLRMRIAEKELQAKGYETDTLGLYPDDHASPETSRVFLLPVPSTRDGKTVFCPLGECNIPLSEIERIAENRLVLCACHSFEHLRYIDYCENDAYAIRNAVPTAEGAIKIAIEETPFTLFGCSVLVIGGGRVGRILCDRLKGFGCRITVTARKDYDRAYFEAIGMKTVHPDRLAEIIDRFDIIFNTVDVPLLTPYLEKLGNTFLIDLSTQGGFDPNAADRLGIAHRKAGGLPAKTAPQTAGKILAETVDELIRQYL